MLNRSMCCATSSDPHDRRVKLPRDHALLLADDEPELRELVGAVLADDGWEVVEVGDGEAALSALAHRRFAAVLLDNRMPRLTGTEVCQRLRAAGDDTPVILMTAAHDIARLARALGVPRALGKPFDIDELLAAVHDVADDRS